MQKGSDMVNCKTVNGPGCKCINNIIVFVLYEFFLKISL